MNKDIKNQYNINIEKVYGNKYEFNRWFKTSRLRLDFKMMYEKIAYVMSRSVFTMYFELGPGPGTWTRIAFNQNPEAQFKLVDISEEMKKQFFLEMRGGNHNVTYEVSDYLDYPSDGNQCDLFFSSRAIEYIDGTKNVLQKTRALLRDGGGGIIVTKNPNYFNFRKDNRSQHQNQISVTRMKELLEEVGFNEIKFTPCIVRVPIIDRFSTYFSEQIFRNSFKESDQKISPFCESYIVTFSK